MKTNTKNYLSIIIVSIIILFATITGIYVYKASSDITFVGFSKKENKIEAPFDISKIENYESKFAEYNSYVYYNKLSENNQKVYRAFEYALDHAYTEVFIDNTLLSENYSAKDILLLLSLDSPLVEQNLVVGNSNFNVSVSKGIFNVTTNVNGTYLHIENFASNKLTKKQEAILRAKEIVSNMNPNLSETEKITYLYNYLFSNVKYQSYNETDDKNYLFDALVRNQSQCDGFANALNLLSNLSGINSFEKDYVPENGAGHTWNCIEISGKWYNFDASGNEPYFGYDIDSRIGFGYSDKFQHNPHRFSELAPVANEELTDIIPRYCIQSNTFIEDTVSLIKETNCFSITSDDYPDKQAFNEISSKSGCGFRYQMSTGKNCVITFLVK